MRLAILAFFAVGACAPITPGPDTQITIAKADFAFEESYNLAAQTYLAAAPKLPAATKAQAKTLLLQMLDCRTDPCTGYVQLARNAVKASDSATLASEVVQITSLAGQVTKLVKGN